MKLTVLSNVDILGVAPVPASWTIAQIDAYCEGFRRAAVMSSVPFKGSPVVADAVRAPDDERAALLELWSTHIDASVRAELMGALVRYLDATELYSPCGEDCVNRQGCAAMRQCQQGRGPFTP